MFQRTAMVMLFILPCLASAQTSNQSVRLHGFGEWSYVRTDGNQYFGAGEEGDFDRIGLALNVSSQLSERLAMVGQMAIRNRDTEDPQAALDYAFARWQLTETLQFRIGRAKHPFGIYTETFDVGTLRPFFDLPQSLYGPSEIAAQSYDGVGLFGSRSIFGSSKVEYDVYVGEIGFAAVQRIQEEQDEAEFEKVRDVVGGRLRFLTPVSGLSFGGSAYSGKLESEEDEGEQEHGVASHSAYGLQAEYFTDRSTVRSEVARHSEENESDTTGLYVEGSYRFASGLEVAARFDRLHGTTNRPGEEDVEPVKHRDLSVGLNYWPNANFVLKLSVHRVNGFAVARAIPGADSQSTTAVVFGSQFSF